MNTQVPSHKSFHFCVALLGLIFYPIGALLDHAANLIPVRQP